MTKKEMINTAITVIQYSLILVYVILLYLYRIYNKPPQSHKALLWVGAYCIGMFFVMAFINIFVSPNKDKAGLNKYTSSICYDGNDYISF